MGLMGDAGTQAAEEITADMLDYTYVQECTDANKLRGILEKLTSNEFGHYPDLEVKAKEKLLSLLSPAEVTKFRRLEHRTTDSEVADAQFAVSYVRCDVLPVLLHDLAFYFYSLYMPILYVPACLRG